MATKAVSKYEFAGLPIYDIMGKPLIAIARAQSMMAKEQLRSLLESCFRYKDGVYEPVLLKMTLTRSYVQPVKKAGDTPELSQITTFFYLPMVTIFPITSLGIETAEIDFNVEITSQFREETDKEDLNPFNQAVFDNMPSAGIFGKITGNSSSEDESEKGLGVSPSLHITVEAGKLPLPKGLLEIINIYSNSIQTTDAQTTSEKTKS